MERSEIIRMAREAGINFDPAGPGDDGIDTWYGHQYLPCGVVQRLIEIAQAEEREACAKVCDKIAGVDLYGQAGLAADAIRERSNVQIEPTARLFAQVGSNAGLSVTGINNERNCNENAD